MVKDWSNFIKVKIRKYDLADKIKKKTKVLGWLAERNKSSINELKSELKNTEKLAFTDKQIVEHKGEREERFKCYFVFSNSKGRCFVIRLNHNLKIITVFPLGRKTLKKKKKHLNRDKH